MMQGRQTTLKGFAVRRRCDACGTRIDMAVDEGEKCILICPHCGKEYRFRIRAQQNSDPGFPFCFPPDSAETMS